MHTLQRLLQHDEWANTQAYAALPAAEKPTCDLFAHIVAAEHLWLERLRGSAKRVAVWPEWPLDRIRLELEALPAAWRELLRTAELDGVVTYQNSKGETWKNSVRDIVLHVTLHSAYHRGQLAQSARSRGETPVYTDYIHCVRQGFLD